MDDVITAGQTLIKNIYLTVEVLQSTLLGDTLGRVSLLCPVF